MPDTPIILGKYQLLKLLARSRTAEVWKARSHGVEGFEKLLVIKRVAPELSRNERFVALFIEEAKTAVMLTHANIAQVFDLGLADGCYFIAMEHVRGPDLGRVLHWCRQKQQRISEVLALYIVSELAKGLDYAHRRRDVELRPLHVVHRAVAPENVLLSYEGDVKLTDFGMTRARECVWPIAELPPEKLAYLAPEQVRAEPLDARADVYALGVLLYELMLGQRVVERERAHETLERALCGERLPLDAAFRERSPVLTDIIERATAPRRDDRHESAGALYEQLIERLYESGRRVGALELSRRLEELARDLDAPSESFAAAPRSGLEQIFDATMSVESSVRVERSSIVHDVPAGERISTPGSCPPASAEWRDVSVLMLEGLQPHELRTMTTRYGGELLDPLCVFGLDEAGGRDAHAAARCGLRMLHQREGEKVRGVVHSGRLLLDADGRPGNDPSREALRATAARTLKRARRGELVATPAASSLLESRFELTADRGDQCRRVERERHPHERLGRFVGRREELRAIGEIFAAANRGELSVLGIRGDAGMGKSRLIVEIERRLRHAGHDVGFYIASSAPQGRAIALSGISDMVRQVLELGDEDPPEHWRERVERLRLLGLDVAQRAAMARLIGLPVAEAPSGQKLTGALVRIAYKLAEDRLTVFVWDGTEQMDDATRALLTKLLTAPRAARILVIMAYRPSSETSWSALPGFREVALEPLADEEMVRLTRHRLGVAEVEGALMRELQRKTGGNPLFVEELLAAMRDHGALTVDEGVARLVPGGPVELPRTLRGLVAARTAKLPAQQRLILQLAVIAGSRFSPELLAQASGLDEATVRHALVRLSEREVIRRVRPGEYVFANELLREVLMAAIPLVERSALHATIARALEQLFAASINAVVDRLAYHYREAGQRESAIHFLTRAGEHYESEHAIDAAIDAYGEVLALIDQADAPDRGQLLALHARIGELAYRTRTCERHADRLSDAMRLAASWGREGYVARFAMLRGRLLNRASRFREGRSCLAKANELARRLEDRGLERDIALATAEAYARNGEYKSVLSYVESALLAAREIDDRPSEVHGLVLRVIASAAIGRISEAQRSLRALEEIAGDCRDRHVQVELARARSLVHEAEGDAEAAKETARRALELAKEYGLTYEVAVHAHRLGTLHLRADEDKRAFAALRLSNEVSSEHGYTRLQWRNVCFLGFLDAMRFDSEQGRARMQQAIDHAHDRNYVLDLIDEKYLLAMVEQKRGELDRARALLREVVQLAEPHGHARPHEDASRALAAIEDGAPIALPR